MPRSLCTLDWNQPLLAQALERLAARAQGRPWDLGAWLVLVPTREAGRRLRQGLALRAAEEGTGVLVPRVWVRENLADLVRHPRAPRLFDRLATWAQVLLEIPLSAHRALFPVDPARRDGAWALAFSRQMCRLQDELETAGLGFASLVEKAWVPDEERERWASLSQLEQRVFQRLEERGHVCTPLPPPPPPPGLAQLLLLAPPRLGLRERTLLEAWSATLPLETWVSGDPESPRHDEWGQALPGAHRRQDLELNPETCVLQVGEDQTAAAERVAALACQTTSDEGRLALVLAGEDLVGDFCQKLEEQGLRTYRPSGRPLRQCTAGRLLGAWLTWIDSKEPEAVLPLLREPLVHRFGRSRGLWTAEQSQLLQAYDALRFERLPKDLEACLAFAREAQLEELAAALAWLLGWRARFPAPRLCHTLREAMAEILLCAEGLSWTSVEQEAAEACVALLDQLVEVEAEQAGCPQDFWPRLIQAELASTAVYPEREPGAWEFQGWMELPFEQAPHLVLGPLNESYVPEALPLDPFLPESLRKRLGLETQDSRADRDRLLLEAALRGRSRHGRVDLLVLKQGVESEPLQPSRLLFACPDGELLRRARHLFAPLPPAKPQPARRRAWRLQPLPAKLPERFSPSALKLYLDCPFRYYLEKGLGMRAVDAEKRELEATEFGNLCHQALETFAQNPSLRDLEDPAAIAAFLEADLRAEVAKKYGQLGTLALGLQVEAASVRLRAAARLQASLHCEGWRIEETEAPWSLEFEGVRFSGIIDRIDRHLDGTYRVIDYKTFDRVKAPEAAHLGNWPTEDAHLLPEARLEFEGKTRRWLDLQLPLYAAYVQLRHGVLPQVAYFLLPSATEETALRCWEEFDRELCSKALACARAAGSAIRRGRFWPPAPKPGWSEDFQRLFPEGHTESLAFEGLLGTAEAPRP